MLEVKNLFYKYGKQHVLNGINLDVKKGDLITLLGANGAGKSTLLNCMVGLLKPSKGEVLLEKTPISSWPAKEVAKKIAYVSQEMPQTFKYVVRDYVVMGRASHLGLFSKPAEEDYKLVDEILDRLNIQKLANKLYMNTSGGEKQLINVARILAQEPEMILFDEPTSALDYGNTYHMLELVTSLAQENFTIIMTTHDPNHPILLHEKIPTSKVAMLNHDGNLNIGSLDEILTEESLRNLYRIDVRLLSNPNLNRLVCAIEKL